MVGDSNFTGNVRRSPTSSVSGKLGEEGWVRQNALIPSNFLIAGYSLSTVSSASRKEVEGSVLCFG